MKVIVSNIQRFCLHDGPGIRTTVFLKGCNLRCPWCCNPENIDFNIQEYVKDGVKGIVGREISLEELKEELLKDKNYYCNGGGVTFSGGEPLLQFESMEPLFIELKKANIHMCLETSLICPTKSINIALKYIDLFYIDIKIIDKKAEQKINTNVALYLNNIKRVFDNNKNVIFRIPLVDGYTYTDENIKEIIKFLSKYKPIKIEIFEVHRIAENKYMYLDKKMEKFNDINEKDIIILKNTIEKLGINVEFCKI